MKRLARNLTIGVAGALLGLLTGCATAPGGVAASTTPLEGRSYQVVGYTEATDSRICLFGIIPLTGGNHLRDALHDAARKISADALIEVTVESHWEYWLLFSRDVTEVQGIGIRFTR